MSPEPGAVPAGPPGVVVLGVGNILYGDEGAGVFAAHALQRSFRWTPEVEIVDGATLGFDMFDVFRRARTVIVLDALATEAAPGSIFRLPAEQLLQLGPEFRPTAHEVDPIQLLRMAPLFGPPPDMVLFGVVPASTGLGVGLSPPLGRSFDRLLAAAVSELASRGVTGEQVGPVDLDGVISSVVGAPT